MAKLSADLRTGTLHPRENLSARATLSTIQASIECYSDGASTASLAVSGSYNGVLSVEGSIDGVNWDAVPMRMMVGVAYTTVIPTGATGRWLGLIGPYLQIRVRMSNYASGAANVVLMASNGSVVSEVAMRATELYATATGTSGSAVTLSLAAPGTGLYHYITRLSLQRFAAAALSAAATPVVVTTTNLPGSRAFSVPAEAAAQGQCYAETVEPGFALRSGTVNTATTIVAPATTSTIWRISADYFTGP